MPKKRVAELPLMWEPPPSRKWSDAEGREMYEVYKRVGLTVPEFARRTGLSRVRVWAWVKKYGAAEPSGFRALQFPKETAKRATSKATAIPKAPQPVRDARSVKGERNASDPQSRGDLEIVVARGAYVIRLFDGASETMALRMARALNTPRHD